MVASDSFIYEKASLECLLRAGVASPMTREGLKEEFFRARQKRRGGPCPRPCRRFASRRGCCTRSLACCPVPRSCAFHTAGEGAVLSYCPRILRRSYNLCSSASWQFLDVSDLRPSQVRRPEVVQRGHDRQIPFVSVAMEHKLYSAATAGSPPEGLRWADLGSTPLASAGYSIQYTKHGWSLRSCSELY